MDNKDNDLVRLSLDDLRNVQLNILKYVAKICDENEISYFLDSGTLLGAVRHKGFIPWDDDIDIGMLRDDYDKFVRLMSKLPHQRYKFNCYELDNSYLYPYGKMFDCDTILYKPDENGMRSSVNIDIFPYDDAPDDDKTLKRMIKRRDTYRMFNYLRNRLIEPNSLIKKIIVNVSYVVLSVLPRDFFVKKMLSNEKLYHNRSTKRIANFYGVSYAVCDRSIFSAYTFVEFEGNAYKAPEKYGEWLTINYGDYMQLPPVEKRVSHHGSFKAYIINKNSGSGEML